MRRLILPPNATVLPIVVAILALPALRSAAETASEAAASQTASEAPDSRTVADDTLQVGDHGFARRQLINGLTALAISEPDADQTVSVFIAVDAGNRYETADTTGLAHLAEHALFTGTERTGTDVHEARIAELGGESNATTRDDYVLIYDHRIPAPALREVLAMEADRLRGLRFDPDPVRHERDRLTAEEARTNTRGMARSQRLEAEVFRVHPYRFGVLEATADGALHTHGPGLDVATVRAFYDAHYHPNRAVVTVVGAIDPSVALDAVEEAFGALPRGADAPSVDQEPDPTAPRTVRVPSELAADRVEAVWIGPPMGDADRVALHALMRWLGRRTLADGTPVEASMGSRRDRDLIRVSATGPRAEAGLAEWIDRIRQEPLPAADVDLVKDLLRDDFTGLELRARPYFSLAAEIAIHSVIGHPEWPGAWAERVDALNSSVLRAVARRHLGPERRTTLVFEGTGRPPAPLPDAAAELRQAAIDATEAGELDRAIRAYSLLLGRQPNRMNTVIYLASRGQIHMQRRAYDAAIRDFEDALQVVDYPAVRDLLTEARRLRSSGGLRETGSGDADSEP